MNRWEYELLDHNDNVIGILDGVTGGSAEIVALSALGGSGTLMIDERGADIDWMAHRVRAIFHSPDGSWPVGTFLLTSPVETHTPSGVSYDVGLLTKMNIPYEDTVDARFSLNAGAPIIASVVALLQSTGESRMAVTTSSLTLATSRTWDAGTPKLEIINELLEAAGYWSLWCDGSGMFRVEPYVNPADRPVAFTFEYGDTSVYLEPWTFERDMSSVPNRVVAVGQGDDDTWPLVGVAKNEDPDSPYSFQARGGRWITLAEEGVEGETQQIMDQWAERKLRDAMSPVSKITVDHKMLPLEANQVVSFIPEDGVERLATVQRMSMSFTFDTDISAEWRLV